MTIINTLPLPLPLANAEKSHLTSLDELSFCTENINYPFYKTGYLIEEVYCTESSPQLVYRG